jgi:hypothetical protein
MKKDHNSIWNRKDEGITHNKDDTISKNISSENIPKKRRISKLAVILISIAIVLIIIFLIIFKLNFLIGEELRITLTPEYSEINTTGSSIAPFTVDTKLYNKFVCDATCNYSLTDISHNVILDNGSFNSKAYKNKPYEFDIPLDYLGYGTNTYIYKIDCINIRTAVCPTDNGIIIRKSLLVVQYSPSVEQMNAAESSENSYAIITNNVINASRLILNSENILNNVDLPFDKSRFNVMTS